MEAGMEVEAGLGVAAEVGAGVHGCMGAGVGAGVAYYGTCNNSLASTRLLFSALRLLVSFLNSLTSAWS